MGCCEGTAELAGKSIPIVDGQGYNWIAKARLLRSRDGDRNGQGCPDPVSSSHVGFRQDRGLQESRRKSGEHPTASLCSSFDSILRRWFSLSAAFIRFRGDSPGYQQLPNGERDGINFLVSIFPQFVISPLFRFHRHAVLGEHRFRKMAEERP